jgi:predicted alpha/beta superfamily hydrolase
LAAPAGGTPIVIGQSHELTSTYLGETRRLNVWLPASYKADGPRLPVLYLLDGGVDEDFHHISGLANISGAYGLTREFIVVGVESGPNRRYHMTSRSEDPDDLKAIPRNGGAAEYRRFLGGEVFEWVETRYRASSERVLMGESLAGLFVVETLLRQPAMFSSYIAVDPSLWWAKGALVRDATLAGWRPMDTKRRAFIALSAQGPAAEGAALRDGLAGAVELDYRVMADETHASIYHPAATQAFRAIFAPLPAT